MQKISDVSESGEQLVIEAFFNLVPPKYRILVGVGAFEWQR